MKLIQTLCCSALINPFYPMVEVTNSSHALSSPLQRLIAYFLAGECFLLFNHLTLLGFSQLVRTSLLKIDHIVITHLIARAMFT